MHFILEIPNSFFKVLNAVFFIGAPDILDCISEAKIHMLGDLDALNAARMDVVVLGF